MSLLETKVPSLCTHWAVCLYNTTRIVSDVSLLKHHAEFLANEAERVTFSGFAVTHDRYSESLINLEGTQTRVYMSYALEYTSYFN